MFIPESRVFSTCGFLYFGHFSCLIFFPVFSRLAHLTLQNVNTEFVIFHIFVTLLPKVTKNEKWDEQNINLSKMEIQTVEILL